jgi:aminoglycoside phosphotransferase (APT) family kinase protein
LVTASISALSVLAMVDDLGAELAEVLAPRLGPGLTVSDVRRLSSGASRQTWRFDATPTGGPRRRYVLQREMVAGGPHPDGGPQPLGVGDQARLLTAARREGVPVPVVVASGEMKGLQFIVSEWLEGEALPPPMLRDPALAPGRARLTQDCARALAAIHRISSAENPGLEHVDRLAVYRQWLDAMAEPRPVLEFAYRWLVRNRPPPGSPVVVHGDFRLGNLLVSARGLEGVLDWELAHIGDRHEDLAWPTIRAWRFDRYRQPGTFPEPDAWLSAYADAAGSDVPIDLAAFRWWQVAGTWIWAVMSGMLARRHLEGWVASVEHAMIGRRVCESEWDLLELLACSERAVSRSAAGGAAAAGELHGRPTARELVEAVAGFLRQQLEPQLDGVLRYQLRIAIRSLEVVGRELDLGPDQEGAHQQRLASLGVDDYAGLAAAIRAGRFDEEPELAGLVEVLRADAQDRLLVANPRWLQPDRA